ncbi:MAG TPA: hypothetical protein VGW39_12870 [Chthoniobacterales bacterium]|nr:hypothetical protein [Chthoniobacterales bacterium]
MANSSTSVVPVGPKVCKPFLLDVMVFSPEAGFKFHVSVERDCTPTADAIWKIVFDLSRVVAGSPDVLLVHVSFTSGTPVEQQAVQDMASQGVTPAQADVLVNQVYPAAKAIVGNNNPSDAEKQQIHDAMAQVVNVNV